MFGLFVIGVVAKIITHEEEDRILGRIMWIVSFSASAMVCVGIWLSLADRWIITSLPFNLFDIFPIFTIIGILCILFSIGYYIVEKYIKKVEKFLKWIYQHIIKTTLTVFSFVSVVITIVAYILGMKVIRDYNLSFNFLMPKVAQAILIVILCALLLTVLILLFVLAYMSINKKISYQKNKKKRFKNIFLLMIDILSKFCILILTFAMLYIINRQVSYFLDKTTTSIIVIISFFLILISFFLSILLENGIIKNQEQFHSKDNFLIYSVSKTKKKNSMKIMILLCFCIPYLLVSIISIINFGAIVFTPNVGKNEYEYITTPEYGDCVILMKIGSEYVLEKFTYDEDNQTITIYTDQYYVQNLSSAEIKKIPYNKEVLVPNNSE